MELTAIFLLYIVLPAQLTRSKDFFCRNELVQLNCTVRSGVLEWRFNPQSLPSKSGSFFRGIDALNRELTTSWPGLTMRLTYVAANATHMESTAHFVAASEFHRMAITCAGQSEASMVLMIASKTIFWRNDPFCSCSMLHPNLPAEQQQLLI